MFTGIPVDDAAPKSEPDDNSLEAGWFSIEEIVSMDVRNEEVFELVKQLPRDAQVAPLDLLGSEE